MVLGCSTTYSGITELSYVGKVGFGQFFQHAAYTFLSFTETSADALDM